MNPYQYINWNSFLQLNPTGTALIFEELCTELFVRNVLNEKYEYNTYETIPGIELAPVFYNGRWVSLQVKCFNNRIGWKKLEDSIQKAIKEYTNKLDEIYILQSGIF